MTNNNEEPRESLPEVRSGQLVQIPRQSLGVVVRSVFFCDLKPLPLPQANPDLSSLSGLERAIEVLRYNSVLLEYRLGSNGWLRAWILSTVKVLLFLLVPLAAFLILLAVLVPAVAGIAQIFAGVEAACKSIFWTVIYLFLTLVAVAAVIAFVGTLSRHTSSKNSANRRDGRPTTERRRRNGMDSRQH